MTLKTIGILCGFFCLSFGGLLFYYHGYKNSSFIVSASIILIYLGWILFIASMFGTILLANKKIKFAKYKLLWLKDKIFKLLIYMTLGIAIVGTTTLISNLGERRVVEILKTEPTENTIGTIVRIERRNTRGGVKLWAIVEYQTKTINVAQAIYNQNNRYSVGEKYLLRYSIDNPEMFELIAQQR